MVGSIRIRSPSQPIRSSRRIRLFSMPVSACFPQEVLFPEFAYGGLADDGEVEDYLFRLGAVGDYVWKDADEDDIRDPWEPGITNVRVFVDLDMDGVFDANEPSTFTDTKRVLQHRGIQYGHLGDCRGYEHAPCQHLRLIRSGRHEYAA